MCHITRLQYPHWLGGGNHPKPDEISLVHNGTLFLDELSEFVRNVLEVLREPLETGHITISRALGKSIFQPDLSWLRL